MRLIETESRRRMVVGSQYGREQEQTEIQEQGRERVGREQREVMFIVCARS